MFTSQWYVEYYFAPMLVWLSCEILKAFFVQIVEFIKKTHFILAILLRKQYISPAARRAPVKWHTSWYDDDARDCSFLLASV